MNGEPTRDELRERANRALADLAAYQGGGSYVWVVVREGEKIGGCSTNLRPYQDAFENEVMQAVPMEICATGDALPKTEATFAQNTRTRHTDLHPIVAVLMAKLNEINGHNSPRTMAIKHPDTLPLWFPHRPKVYAERTQAMSLPQLFQVLDAIFGHVRRHVAAIHSLHSAVASHFRVSSVPTRTRACFEAFFDFLRREAEEIGGKPRGARSTPRGGVSPSVGTPPGARLPAAKSPGEANGTTPRGGPRRRGLRNSPTPERTPAGGLFLPSPGPHPSEMVGDLDEDVPILDNPKSTITRGRRAKKGDQIAGGAGKASPKTESESPWAEEDELARGVSRSYKRRRESSRIPPGSFGGAGTPGKRTRVKTEVDDAFAGRAESDLSAHSSTPRVDVPLAMAECAESRPEIQSNGVGVEHSGGAGPELGGKGWDDGDSEHSFDQLLNNVDWEQVENGLRAETEDAGSGGMDRG
ncbi:hypothetical protein KFL_004720090 [Klebsormidium nitens]|uniref:Uncharacterized protein n=1 Tax=Klebsormidium nitens TaxID=105231 RepID=A0A0U9HVQ1_KLENI|nr:hypothetical protein KFL_004720090 [Klebsormidium nitens]|eukprot:GAQ88950.1 hypothetical protein KFL_004720090 [Klebsormidium nitens]